MAMQQSGHSLMRSRSKTSAIPGKGASHSIDGLSDVAEQRRGWNSNHPLFRRSKAKDFHFPHSPSNTPETALIDGEGKVSFQSESVSRPVGNTGGDLSFTAESTQPAVNSLHRAGAEESAGTAVSQTALPAAAAVVPAAAAVVPAPAAAAPPLVASSLSQTAKQVSTAEDGGSTIRDQSGTGIGHAVKALAMFVVGMGGACLMFGLLQKALSLGGIERQEQQDGTASSNASIWKAQPQPYSRGYRQAVLTKEATSDSEESNQSAKKTAGVDAQISISQVSTTASTLTSESKKVPGEYGPATTHESAADSDGSEEAMEF